MLCTEAGSIWPQPRLAFRKSHVKRNSCLSNPSIYGGCVTWGKRFRMFSRSELLPGLPTRSSIAGIACWQGELCVNRRAHVIPCHLCLLSISHHAVLEDYESLDIQFRLVWPAIFAVLWHLDWSLKEGYVTQHLRGSGLKSTWFSDSGALDGPNNCAQTLSGQTQRCWQQCKNMFQGSSWTRDRDISEGFKMFKQGRFFNRPVHLEAAWRTSIHAVSNTQEFSLSDIIWPCSTAAMLALLHGIFCSRFCNCAH